MIAALVSQYQRGAITADHCLVQCLHMIDPEHPERVLAGLPPELLDRLSRFVARDQAGRLVTNYGPLPAADQLAAARRWLEAVAAGANQEAAANVANFAARDTTGAGPAR